MKRYTRPLAGAAAAMALAVAPVHADEVRARSRQNVSVNRSTNVNRNTNVNVNVDRDVHVHGAYYGGCCYNPHPVATAAAVTATVVATAAIVGSVVTVLPAGCTTVVVNGFAYRQCGTTWYQPQISGSTTTYVVVTPR